MSWRACSLVLGLLLLMGSSSGQVVCTNSDCIAHDITSQTCCTEVLSRGPQGDCRWKAGLSTNADYIIEHGEVIAYKIQWFNGDWSGWYVTGVNDNDWKFNTATFPCSLNVQANGMRRVWSYFFDHTHRYIICGPCGGADGGGGEGEGEGGESDAPERESDAPLKESADTKQ